MRPVVLLIALFCQTWLFQGVISEGERCFDRVDNVKWTLTIECLFQTSTKYSSNFTYVWENRIKNGSTLNGSTMAEIWEVHPLSNEKFFYEGMWKLPLPPPTMEGLYIMKLAASPQDIMFQRQYSIERPGELTTDCPQYVSEGSKVTCDCIALHPGNPQGHWSWLESRSKRLEVPSVQLWHNRTLYTCEISWGSLQYNYVIRTNITFIMRVARVPFGELTTNCPEYVQEGEELRCDCIAPSLGYPEGNCSWEGFGSSRLRVSGVQVEDSERQFACHLKWGYTEHVSLQRTVTYTLKVIDYDIGIETRSSTQRVVAGPSGKLKTSCPDFVPEDGNLTCDCFVSSTARTETVLQWDGHESARLNVLNVQQRDNGTRFTCRLVSGLTNSSTNMYVTVTLRVAALRRFSAHAEGEDLGSRERPYEVVLAADAEDKFQITAYPTPHLKSCSRENAEVPSLNTEAYCTFVVVCEQNVIPYMCTCKIVHNVTKTAVTGIYQLKFTNHITEIDYYIHVKEYDYIVSDIRYYLVVVIIALSVLLICIFIVCRKRGLTTGNHANRCFPQGFVRSKVLRSNSIKNPEIDEQISNVYDEIAESERYVRGVNYQECTHIDEGVDRATYLHPTHTSVASLHEDLHTSHYLHTTVMTSMRAGSGSDCTSSVYLNPADECGRFVGKESDRYSSVCDTSPPDIPQLAHIPNLRE